MKTLVPVLVAAGFAFNLCWRIPVAQAAPPEPYDIESQSIYTNISVTGAENNILVRPAGQVQTGFAAAGIGVTGYVGAVNVHLQDNLNQGLQGSTYGYGQVACESQMTFIRGAAHDDAGVAVVFQASFINSAWNNGSAYSSTSTRLTAESPFGQQTVDSYVTGTTFPGQIATLSLTPSTVTGPPQDNVQVRFHYETNCYASASLPNGWASASSMGLVAPYVFGLTAN